MSPTPLHVEAVEALRAHTPDDANEARFVRRMLELAGAPGAFSRDHFEPGHFTASAFVLSPARDDLLLIFHKKLSLWLQPGGHVEPTDTSLLAAAQREVTEETGIVAAPAHGAGSALFDVDVHRIPARPSEPTHEHFDLRFLLVASSDDAVQTDEVGGVRWVRLDALADVTRDESVLRAARKITGRRRNRR